MNHDGAGFGARLHAYRVSVRLSQEELAERSGVSVRTISNLERGRARWPYPDTVRRLADALRLPAEARAEFAAAAGRRLAGHGPGALAGELAIEPGPGLRELHERILAGDACILPASPTAGAAQPMPADATIPRQLPAAVRSFVGRRAEFSMLCSLAEQAAERVEAGGVVISAIDGMAGIGKTALAVRAAHQLTGFHPSPTRRAGDGLG